MWPILQTLSVTFYAGRGVLAVSMVTPNDMSLVQAIEAHTSAKWKELETDTRVA